MEPKRVSQRSSTTFVVAGSASWQQWLADFFTSGAPPIDVLYEARSLDEVRAAVADRNYQTVVLLSHHATLARDALWAQELRETGIEVVAQPPEVADIAFDKRQMAKLAACQNYVLPIMEMGLSDASRSLGARGAPVIVKPASGTEGHGFRVVAREDHLRSAPPSNDELIQPFVFGREYSVNICRVGGVTVGFPIVEKGETSVNGVHPSQRLRHCPPRGIDSAVETALWQASFAMADAARMDGICEFEFIVSRDGLYLVEINPRVAATMRMSSLACGVSIFDQLVVAGRNDRFGNRAVVKAVRHSLEFPVPASGPTGPPKGRWASDVWITTRATIVGSDPETLDRRAEQVRRAIAGGEMTLPA